VSTDKDAIRIAPLMTEIEGDARRRLRRSLVDHGVKAYEDPELFDRVYTILEDVARRASVRLPSGAPGGLLLPELLGDDVEWALDPNLRLSSHRQLFGRALVFAKRWLILPLTRWLFEYSQANFRRQQRLNRILFACIEELAIENARLRGALTAPSSLSSQSSQSSRSGQSRESSQPRKPQPER
jgi:hypothetical protein